MASDNPYENLAEENPYSSLAEQPREQTFVRTLLGLPPISEKETAFRKQLRENGWGTGIPQLGNQAGGAVTDALAKFLPPEFAAAGGYGANVLTQAAPALFSFNKGNPAGVLAERPARWLMQSAVKPEKADRLSGDADKAIGTMLQEGINATRGGMDKATGRISDLNKQVQSAVAASPESVSVLDVGSRLKDPYKAAMTQVNPQSDMAAVEGAWNAFKKSPLVREQAMLQKEFGPALPGGDVSLPVQLAQKLKSGTYKSLGSKAYGEVGSSSIEAQKALARGLREEIASKVPGVVEPLKREASLMNVLDVARNRALLNANSNPGSLALLAENPLAGATFMADKSALIKSLLARGLYTGSRSDYLLPGVMAGSEAIGMRGILQGQE